MENDIEFIIAEYKDMLENAGLDDKPAVLIEEFIEILEKLKD